ncbi:MAG TPA: AAA family ATPase [Planctomicrobium sp.]|nr:AAA family ATPase [Planctomicrobium sp.]
MNPFRDGIVADPWRIQFGDVPGIHHAVYEQCLTGLQQVRQNHRSAGLLIHGEAGSGKTHLLSRLRTDLTPNAPSATDREENLFVWVRLQTSSRMIWRTIRRTLVNDWFRPIAGNRSQFDRILSHRLAEIRVATGDLEPWIEFMQQEHPEELSELIDRIATHLDLDRNTAIAFEHLAFNRHRRDLRAWLSGDILPEAALVPLNLSQEEGTEEEREEEAQRVVVMLCRLAGHSLPIVMGLDQVEALQLTPRDTEGLFAFGKLISTLHDSTENVLLVSCVQSAFATELKDHARSADYDRMTSLGSLSLDPLNRTEAQDLIAVRRAKFEAPIEEDLNAEPAWPLLSQEFENLFQQDRPVTPRRLFALCAERFENRLHGTPIVTEIVTELLQGRVTGRPDEFLEQTWQGILDWKRADNTSDQSEEILRHGLPMLCLLLKPDQRLVEDKELPDVSLVFEYGLARVGVSCCTQSNMNSLQSQFRRLRDQVAQRRVQRMILLRDARLPISSGAKKTRESLEELERQGATLLSPDAEMLVTIDALRDLLSDAKSGDLSYNGETISPETVSAWLRPKLNDNLKNFVEQIFKDRNS